jgi:hypothetical protein
MSDDKPMLALGRYEELALSELARFPVLAQCHAAWLAAGKGGRLPASIDLACIPPETLPYTMLLDYLPAAGDVRVRIAGTYVGEHSTFRDSGRGLRGFFNETDAAIVYESLVRIAAAKTPSLARRDYVTIEGSRYSYTRLIMPLAADGQTVSGFFKTIEPASLHIE